MTIRRAVARLLTAPVFSATFIAMLAIVLAGLSAVGSLNALLLLKQLPYPQPERLMEVRAHITAGGHDLVGTSPGFARAWGDALESRADFALERSTSGYLRSNGQDIAIEFAYVDPSFFDVLGMRLTIGDTGANEGGGPEPAILSDAFAVSLFGTADAAVGRFVEVDGVMHPVVGIAAPGLVSPGQLRGREEQFWLVYRDIAAQRQQWGNFTSNLHVLVRPQDGLDADQVRSLLEPLTAQLARTSAARAVPPDFAITPEVVDLRDAVLGSSTRTGVLMLCATALLALLAGSVLVTMGIARLAAMHPELVVHAAVGARTRDLAKLVRVELFVLCCVAACVAWPLAEVGLSAIRVLGKEALPRLVELRLDPWALLLPALVAIVLASVSATAVARTMRRRALGPGLGAGGKGTVSGFPPALRRLLLATQFFLIAGTLFIVSVLLWDSGKRLSVDPGYDEDGSVYVQIELPPSLLAAGDKVSLEPQLAGVLMKATGARSYAIADMPPVSAGLALTDVRRPTGELVGQMTVNGVSERYLPGMGFQVLAGRVFVDEDFSIRNPVVVLGRTAAALLVGDASAVGHIVVINDRPHTVVGVVNDVVNPVVAEEGAKLQAYIPFEHWDGVPTLSLFLMGAAHADRQAVSQAVDRLDPALIVAEVLPSRQLLGELLAAYRIKAIIAIVLGAFCLFAAVAGTIAVVSYLFGLSVQELAVRCALGARRQQLVAFLARGVSISALVSIAAYALAIAASIPAWANLLDVSPTLAVAFAALAGVIVLVLAVATAWLVGHRLVATRMGRILHSMNN